jgi:hypothetical protein
MKENVMGLNFTKRKAVGDKTNLSKEERMAFINAWYLPSTNSYAQFRDAVHILETDTGGGSANLRQKLQRYVMGRGKKAWHKNKHFIPRHPKLTRWNDASGRWTFKTLTGATADKVDENTYSQDDFHKEYPAMKNVKW